MGTGCSAFTMQWMFSLLYFLGEFLKAPQVEVSHLGLPVKAPNEMITTQNNHLVKRMFMARRRAPSNVKSFLVKTKNAKPAMRSEYMKTKLNGSTASQSQSHQVSLTQP